MVRKKAVDDMSADELFELAERRRQEEADLQKQAMREEIDALRNERRALVASHKKALAAIDTKIRKLSGKTGGGRGRSKENITDRVVAIVEQATEVSTKEIQAELAKQGIVANNLSQTLAYLKRQGRISSPARSTYAPA